MSKNVLCLFSSNKLTTGGHKRYFELLKNLNEFNNNIYLISPKIKNFNQNIFENYYIKSKPSWLFIPNTLWVMFKILINITKIKSKFINSDYIIIFGITNALGAIILKKVLGIKIVLGIRTNILETRKIRYKSKYKKQIFKIIKGYLYLYKQYIKQIYNYVDLIIVQNKNDKNYIISNSNKNETDIFILPNNINVSWIRNKYENANKSNNLKDIIFIGSLTTRKGVMLLIKAFENSLNYKSDLHLNILGDGPLKKEIFNYIKKSKLCNHINLLGFVNDPLKYLSNSDLLVVPSLLDSFPNTVLESLYVGTPVIGSSVGGIVEQLYYKELLFKPNDINAIKNKIIKLLDNDTYNYYKNLCNKRKKVYVFNWSLEFQNLINKHL